MTILGAMQADGDQDPAWLKLLAKYGLGTVLALVFAYFILGNVSQAQKDQAAEMRQILAVAQQTQADMTMHLAQMEKSSNYLRLICVNIARTPGDRLECLR